MQRPRKSLRSRRELFKALWGFRDQGSRLKVVSSVWGLGLGIGGSGLRAAGAWGPDVQIHRNQRRSQEN